MREQKYYVKLKSPRSHTPYYWCGDSSEWQLCNCEAVYGEENEYGDRKVIYWEVPDWVPAFTKPELAEIMGGALYKKDTLIGTHGERLGVNGIDVPDYGEWINPLIELVPVEDGMTVEQLIKILEQFPKNMEVVYDYDSGTSTMQIYKIFKFNDHGKEVVVIG